MSTEEPRIQRLSSDQRDSLVAYLDGELDEPASQDIEKILARNPVARNDVEMLMRTWELLDTLPRPGASEKFTEETLATLKTIDATQPLSERPWFDKLRVGVKVAGWLVCLVASAAVGFVITSRLVPNEGRTLVENLPLIERLDRYVEVDNITFLEELQRSGMFVEAPPPGSPATPATPPPAEGK